MQDDFTPNSQTGQTDEIPKSVLLLARVGIPQYEEREGGMVTCGAGISGVRLVPSMPVATGRRRRAWSVQVGGRAMGRWFLPRVGVGREASTSTRQ